MSFADLIGRADRVAIDVFGDKSEDGEPLPITYTPDGGAAVTTTPDGDPLTGIFDEQYVLASGTANAGVETLGPAVFLLLEDLPEDPRDEDAEPTITIRTVNYRVIERRPDGMGGIVLALRRIT